MTILVVFAGLIALLLTGMPVFAALGLAATAILLVFEGHIGSVADTVYAHLDKPILITIPLFVFMANVMIRAKAIDDLFDMAHAFVGHIRGGLGVATVMSCTIFAAISGSSVATALSIGSSAIPQMKRFGYPERAALGVIAAGGTLGILIPPSLAFIVYAIIAEQSVPRLFLAGVIPGLMQAALFIGYSVWIAKRRNYPRMPAMPRDDFIRVNIEAIPALLVPTIILGGIYSGIVTVSEAAGIAALVSILVSIFYYRGCKLRDVIPIIGESMRSTMAIVMIIITALAFGHWLTKSGAPQDLADWVVSMDLKTWQFLLIINVFFLILGTFLEVFAIMLITLPIILPLLGPMGVDPIHFAVLMTINMELALLTPPIGLNIFVLSSITKTPVAETIKGVLPFMGLLLLLLILVTYVPAISLWLPNLVYG